jgi:very-short-patch-repair endonuclease
MLVVEVDGASHFEDDARAYDVRRDAFMVARGFRVLRVTTTDVFNRLDDVIAGVLAHAPAEYL